MNFKDLDLDSEKTIIESVLTTFKANFIFLRQLGQWNKIDFEAGVFIFQLSFSFWNRRGKIFIEYQICLENFRKQSKFQENNSMERCIQKMHT